MKIAAILAVLALVAPAAAANGWYVIEYPDHHVCQRVNGRPAAGDFIRHGPFNTFRQAGAWEWRNRPLCKTIG